MKSFSLSFGSFSGLPLPPPPKVLSLHFSSCLSRCPVRGFWGQRFLFQQLLVGSADGRVSVPCSPPPTNTPHPPRSCPCSFPSCRLLTGSPPQPLLVPLLWGHSQLLPCTSAQLICPAQSGPCPGSLLLTPLPALLPARTLPHVFVLTSQPLGQHLGGFHDPHFKR